MDGEPRMWERAEELFHRALAQPPARREAFVEAECGDDRDLLAAVRSLLEGDARDFSLLDRELGRVAGDVLDGSVPVLRQVGPYRIVRVLGRGGMGVVYLADREDLGSQVAIKVLRDAWLSGDRRARFEREERTLAQLNHPSIARLYDADVLPDGTPYFVMEYVEGVPLHTYCRTRNLSLSERLRLFRDICEAVRYAHQQAVIHRDLKPSNVLVTDAGDVKLLDFGIAKRLEGLDPSATHTQTGLRPMTPAYAAPEQLAGDPVGVYTDTYGLGVILFEILTGTHPYDLTDLRPAEIEDQLREQEPCRPSTVGLQGDAGDLGREGWRDLDVLCLTAMHKDPHRRYPSVEALIRDLDHLERGKPLEAREDTLGYRAGKFLRRNRRRVVAVAIVLVLAAGMLGFHTVRLAEQRNLAQREAATADRISEYLIGLFQAGDPYAPDGERTDVRALLEEGERRVDELAAQPAVQATMLNVLGRVYTQLSEYERAESLLTRALALRRAQDSPLDVAESLSSLAGLLVDTGEYDRAQEVLREALAIRERELPPNHPNLAATLSDLGTVHRYKGEYEEAESLQRLALRIRRAAHFEPHEELATTLDRLAVALFQQGKYTEAERYYREALAVGAAVFGPQHVSVTRTMANLGKLYEEVGDYATADSLLTEALRIRRATLGSDHSETAVGLGQLATLVSAMGDHERAELYLREALAIREQILAPDHPNLGTTLNNLASTLEYRGRYDEAAELYRRAAEIYGRSLGPRHRFTAIAISNLAQALRGTGDLQEAHDRYLEALSILEEVHPSNHQELAHNRSRFGGVLVALGRYDEAESLLMVAYEALLAGLGPEHPRTRDAARRLAELYETQGEPDRAAPYSRIAAADGDPDP